MSDPRDPELLPCPLATDGQHLVEMCSEGETYDEHSCFTAEYWWVQCSCGMAGPKRHFFGKNNARAEAAEAWNTRAPTPGALVGEPLTRSEVERAMAAALDDAGLRAEADQLYRRLFGEDWNPEADEAVLYFLAWTRVRPPRDATWREAGSTDVEVVAKAMYLDWDGRSNPFPWEKLSGGETERWLKLARVAVATIRSLVPPAAPSEGGKPR